MSNQGCDHIVFKRAKERQESWKGKQGGRIKNKEPIKSNTRKGQSSEPPKLKRSTSRAHIHEDPRISTYAKRSLTGNHLPKQGTRFRYSQSSATEWLAPAEMSRTWRAGAGSSATISARLSSSFAIGTPLSAAASLDHLALDPVDRNKRGGNGAGGDRNEWATQSVRDGARGTNCLRGREGSTMVEAENSSAAPRLIIIGIGWMENQNLMRRPHKSCFACRPQVPRRRSLSLDFWCSSRRFLGSLRN